MTLQLCIYLTSLCPCTWLLFFCKIKTMTRSSEDVVLIKWDNSGKFGQNIHTMDACKWSVSIVTALLWSYSLQRSHWCWEFQFETEFGSLVREFCKVNNTTRRSELWSQRHQLADVCDLDQPIWSTVKLNHLCSLPLPHPCALCNGDWTWDFTCAR